MNPTLCRLPAYSRPGCPGRPPATAPPRPSRHAPSRSLRRPARPDTPTGAPGTGDACRTACEPIRPRSSPRPEPPRPRRRRALRSLGGLLAGLGLGLLGGLLDLGEGGLELLGGRRRRSPRRPAARGSAASSTPAGSSTSAAVTVAPGSAALDRASRWSGTLVASAVTDRVSWSCTIRVSFAASPVSWTGTSTVTFSPRRTSEQVHVLEGVPDRVTLDRLRQRQHLGAVADLDREELVRARPCGSRRRTHAPAARCAWASRRGRTARRAPCRPGGYDGHHPCRTRYGARR